MKARGLILVMGYSAASPGRLYQFAISFTCASGVLGFAVSC